MPGRTYDFWLLDLDGTLVDIEQSYVSDVFDEIGDRLGISLSDREATLLWYGLGDGRDDLLARRGVESDTFWEVFHEVEEPMARASATYVYEDAEAVVPAIEQPVGVVTHCQEYLTDPVLETLDIADWFDTVVCCSDETGWKPDPAPVRTAMDHLDVGHDGHEGVLVGDNPTDVGAARNAGIDGVFVERRDPDDLGCSVPGERRVTDLTDLDA